MAFSISGFGAVQTYPAPQLFQALSLASAPPVPPAPPYGNPNPNLVDVARTGNPAVPANLTLAAHPTFQALLKVTNQSVLLFGHPALPPGQNTTAAVLATNPSISGQLQGPSPTGISIQQPDLPQGPVSFSLTAAPASLTSGVDALQQTIAQLQQEEAQAQSQSQQTQAPSPNAAGPQTNAPAPTGGSPTGGAPAGGAPSTGSHAPAPTSHATIPATASPGLVGKIVQTVQSLAVAAIYSGPVFSFSA